MIRVTVSIEPGGDPTRAREIADIEVWNYQGDIDEADYRYEAHLEGEQHVEGEVRSHRRSFGWTPLITRVIFDLQQRLKRDDRRSTRASSGEEK